VIEDLDAEYLPRVDELRREEENFARRLVAPGRMVMKHNEACGVIVEREA
jgi:hypothetical protein